MAIYHDWENLDHNKFKQISFDDLKVGDIVMSVTYTYSQKYFMIEGYEEYNMSKIGILLTKDEESPGRSRLYKKVVSDDSGDSDEFEETNFYCDPMNSGSISLYKYDR